MYCIDENAGLVNELMNLLSVKIMFITVEETSFWTYLTIVLESVQNYSYGQLVDNGQINLSRERTERNET